MPRRSGGSGGGRSGGRPRYKASPNPPQRGGYAPPPASATPTGGGLVDSVVEGIGWGLGMYAAGRVMDGLFGPRKTVVVPSEPSHDSAQSTNNINKSDVCARQAKSFIQCVNMSGSDLSKCQDYMDWLSECRRSMSASPPEIQMA